MVSERSTAKGGWGTLKNRLFFPMVPVGGAWWNLGGSAPDGVAGAHADPLGEGAVLLLLLAELLLNLEGLLGRLLMGRAVGGRGQRRFHLLRLERSRP